MASGASSRRVGPVSPGVSAAFLAELTRFGHGGQLLASAQQQDPILLRAVRRNTATLADHHTLVRPP
jgi:hypothetical protein